MSVYWRSFKHEQPPLDAIVLITDGNVVTAGYRTQDDFMTWEYRLKRGTLTHWLHAFPPQRPAADPMHRQT